ncbi:MAG TPA: hypothetical protein VGJ41_15920 [Nocardioides sp.]
MKNSLRMVAFAVALAVLLFGGYAVGRVAGPFDRPTDNHEMSAAHDDAMDDDAGPDDGSDASPAGGETDGAGDMPGMDMDVAEEPGGLSATQDGYTLRLQGFSRAAGSGRRLGFSIIGPNGKPVTAYDTVHEKKLHLIVVRRDLTGFQHVHPVLDAKTGAWAVRVDLEPGIWRVYADFQPTGADALVLGTDLQVPGKYRPASLGGDSLVDRTDGYVVRLTGNPAAGEATTLTLRVSRNGKPVSDLQPYLGAYGHLVAIKADDLSYLHVHPEDGPAGPEIAFHVEVSDAGAYRFFLDFRHGGRVHTAQFTVRVEQP